MPADQWLIVGLGNHGRSYSHNRHNIGYWCVNRLARLHSINLKSHRLATLGNGYVDSVPILLAKPRTYVNRSGHAVSALLKQAPFSPKRMLVICDDLDLPLGRLRLRPKGEHGGHNGLRSIIDAIGGGEFPRLRIGVGRPVVDGKPAWDPEQVADWVLSDPPPHELEALQGAVALAVETVAIMVTNGIETAMDDCNSLGNP